MKDSTITILSATGVSYSRKAKAANEQHLRLLNKYFKPACLFLLIGLMSLTKSYATLTVTLSTPTAVSAASVCQYATNVPIYQFTLTTGGTGFTTGDLTAVTFTQAGSATSGDIVQYKLWSGAISGTPLATSTTASFTGLFVAFSSFTIASTNYFITADIAGAATVGHTIIVSPLTTTNYTMTAGTTKATSGSISTGGTQTITAGATFSGASSLCTGSTIALTGTPTGGAWATSNSTVATVSGGTVGGAAGGTSTISYTVGSCSATQVETVNAIVTPSVSISALPAGAFCTGTSVRISATPTNGGTPTYQWYYNGSLVGAGSSLTSATFANGDMVYCVMTSSLPCTTVSTATSASMTLTVNPAPTITGAATVCVGGTVALTGGPTGGTWSSTATFTIRASVGSVTGVVTGVSAGAATISYTEGGCIGTQAETVSGVVTPSVTVTAFPAGIVCAGVTVTFTPIPVNGGTPTYQWYKNGSPVATTTTYTSSSLSTGDVVSCVMTSTFPCVTSPTATSNSITMTVNADATPSVPALSASSGSCGSITLNWSASTNAANYEVTIASGAGMTGIIYGPTLVGNVTSFTLSTGLTSGTNYYYQIRAENGCGGGYSALTSITTAATTAALPGLCECVPAGNLNCTTGEYIANVTITGTPLNNTTACSTGGYSIYPASGSTTANLVMGNTYTLSATSGTAVVFGDGLEAFIDYSQSNSFSVSDYILISDFIFSANTVYSTAVTIPTTAAAGPTTMRVRYIGDGDGASSATSCTSFGTHGETEDYTVCLYKTTAITAQPAASTTACLGAAYPSLSVTATGSNLTYLWFNNGTTNSTAGGVSTGVSTATFNTASTAATGTTYYYCQMTNVCGIATTSNTAAVIVGSNPTITASATPGTVCAGNTLSLNATPAGGSGTYASYSWSGPGSFTASTQNATNTSVTSGAAGVYSVTVTDNKGCTSTTATTGSVIVGTIPTITATAIPAAVCAGYTLTLNATPTGGSGTYSTFTWSGPGGFTASSQNTTNPGMSALGVGVYSVTVTDNNGCTSAAGTTVSVTLNSLPVIITATAMPTTLCAGATLTLNTTPAGGSGTYTSYSWNGPGSFSASTQNTTNAGITTGGSGIYNVTVTDNNGCTSAAGTTGAVAVNPLPVMTATATPAVLCAAQTLTLNATPAGGSGTYVSFAWNGPGSFTASTQNTTNPGITTAGTGIYSVTVTDNNGCTSMPGTAPVTVNVLPTISATATPNPICAGKTLTLNATPASGSGTYSSYTWSGPSGFSASSQNTSNPGMSTTGVGIYSVSVTDNNGCTAASAGTTASVSLYALPVITATATPTALCAGSNLSLNSSPTGGSGTYSSFSWNGPGSFAASTQNTTSTAITATGAGVYSVTVTDNNGCTSPLGATSAVTVNALPNITSFSIPSATTLCVGGISMVTVNSSSLASATYSVTYNLSGANSATAHTATLVIATSTGTFIIPSTDITNPGLTTVTITSVTSANGCVSSLSAGNSTSFTVNPGSAAIAGSPSVCLLSTITLSDATSSGTWSSSNTAVATIGFSSGFLTGSAIGTATITYTLPTGCFTTTVENVNPIPTIDTVTGGGTFCSSNPTVHVGLSGSDLGASYQIYINGIATGGLITGTGSVMDFGLETVSGVYTVVANPSATCAVTMAGSVTVVNNLLPGVFTVTGGGSLCAGATGVAVGMNYGQPGMSYQLYNGVSTVGSPITGTGYSFNFGLETITGTYTVIATNPSNSCTTAMAGSAAVAVNPLPPAISGTASVCAGLTTALSDGTTGGTWSSGSTGLATVGSSSGIAGGVSAGLPLITYTLPTGCIASKQITVNPTPATPGGASTNVCSGSTITLTDAAGGGTWSSSNTAAAIIGSASGVVTGGLTASVITITYTLPAGCSSVSLVTVNSLPAAYAVTGGGGYCSGGTGAHVSLSGSATGVSYQLYLGGTTASGSPVSGTGSSLDFGPRTAAGAYTAVAANAITGCSSAMPGSATVAINPLPTVYAMSGGGSYCSGSSGVDVSLSFSAAGVSYQLFDASAPIGGAVSGTGASYDFGLQTAGGTYGVIATNSTGCTSAMSGSVVVTVLPLPTAYAVTGGGSYCSGGTGVHVLLSSSAAGVNYQVFTAGSSASGIVAGTSGSIDFGAFTATGIYTITGTNAITGCTGPMSGSVTVTTNPLPVTTYSVTGGGGYCAGASSTSSVGLSNSVTGTSYQLYVGGAPVGTPMPGTGGILNFGIQSTAGAYTVVATTGAGCTGTMAGSATIAVNPLPAVFSVTGGGSYCTGSAASVHVGLNGSAAGVSYQVYNSGIAGAVVAGTGSALDFGALPAGSYIIKATSGAGCVNSMSGSASITTNPLPAVFSVSITPGSNYCAGSAAPHVLLSGSVTGVTYQLVLSGGVVGALPGTGSSLDFGAQPASGVYTVTATTTATGCGSTMSGSATVIANVLPTAYTVTGGGAYCAGGTGRVVSLSGSLSGASYQLYIGGIATGAAVSGSGSGVSFPAQTVAGSYTVIATNTATSCTGNMTGSVSVSTTPLPVVYNVTGGGAYCVGATTGVHVGLSASNTGFTYQLYFGGTTAVGSPVTGTGSALDFGAQTTTGSYTVIATNTTTLCTNNMFGSAVVSTVSYPAAYAVSASGSYCLGGSGLPVTLGSSDPGVSYQLLRGGAAVGSPVTGTGSLLNFGNQTAAGNYTVFATNATGCGSNMTGIDVISINPLPTVFTVTGTGTVYCSGDTGVHIGLNSSVAGFSYQLYNDGVGGSILPGTGSALDFGRQTAGVYTVTAQNNITFCTNNMSGMIVVAANPLPAQYAVTGGGNYCSGGAGLAVGLGNSAAGVSYQLYLGSLATGAAVAGSGLPLNFGLQTVSGTYTVQAANSTTGCTQAMTGSAAIGVSTLPALHNVSGGGNYCTGGTGVDVYIDGSNTGVSYQLYNGITPVGAPMAGTGSAVHFGLQTVAGAYTAVASSGSACTDNMTGSVTVSISPLPAVYTVTGGGNYCPSGTGVHVGLSGSDAGVQYQLFNGTATVGIPVTGTGTSIDFGLQPGTGAYTVAAANPVTTCGSDMSGIVTIGLDPLPAVYNVTGGGSYCAGGTGMAIGINGSASGIDYQLYYGITPLGTPFAGTGFPVSFGLQTAAGAYTVIATNTATTCNTAMTGSAAIIINPLPDTFSVTGGGQYCAGTGGVAVGLRSSDFGVSYQLYQGGIATGIPATGTGAAISFGPETAAGIYTVVATNTGTTCGSNMPGSALVIINPLPVAYAVTGGGNYCPGGAGMHIGLSSSTAGITYQLYNGATPTGIILPGTGTAIDFGLITTTGTYYVEAANTSTSCTSNMAGSAAIGVNPVPAAYTVSSSASQYCAGSAGVNILLSGSATGAGYQLYSGTAASGSPVAGTGIPLSFGTHTAGAYTVVATTIATGCVNDMAGSAAVAVNPLPTAYSVAGGGNYCPGGSGVHVGLSGTSAGVSYQLSQGIYPAGSATGTGSAVDFGPQTAAGTYTVVATDTLTGCSSNMTGSAAVGFFTLPAVYTVTGGGNYCVSGSGAPVGLSGSSVGVTYQLYFGAVATGVPVTGTGALLNFGLQTSIGAYTAVATNSATGCTSSMAGSAAVNTNSLPAAYPISGGGSNCAGGPGFDIGLAGSTPGVNYQLYNGLIPSGIYLPGTGFPLDFGIRAAAGSYTLIGTNITTGCTSAMVGTATIIVNPLPAAYSVAGGGNYCASGPGVHIGLSNSAGGVTYQLFNGATPYGLPVPGITGSSLDFGLITAVGTYSVAATDPVTGCTANMPGTATVAMGLPVIPSVLLSTTGADTLCDGTTVTINTSVINGGTTPSFSWSVNGIPLTGGTGGSLTYAPAVGDVIGVTMTSSAVCASPATASNTLSPAVLPHGMPSILISSSLGDTVCQGAPVIFTQATAFGGSVPALSWMVNGTAVGSTPGYTYTPANGDLVTCVLTSNYRCRLATAVSSNPLNLVVDEPVTPAVTVTASPGTNLPQGQVLSLTVTVTNEVISPSFQWYINGEPIPGATGTVYSTATYSNLDSFSCIVTSGGGCSGLKGSDFAVIHLANEGVQQVASAGSDIRIIPNPNNGIFTIKGTTGTAADEQVSVEITDMLGQVIYKDKVMAHGGNIDEKIQLSNTLANGMYILSLRSASANDVFHVVIEQ